VERPFNQPTLFSTRGGHQYRRRGGGSFSEIPFLEAGKEKRRIGDDDVRSVAKWRSVVLTRASSERRRGKKGLEGGKGLE